MPKRRLTRSAGDVREFPRYSISEAAFYLRMPYTTLHAWTRGQDYLTAAGAHRTFRPLIDVADKKNRLLSFFNLVEAHILRATTDRGIPFENVRAALDFVNRKMPGPHPLVTYEFETSGKEIFVKHLGDTVNATAGGQVAMRQILDEYLKLVPRDVRGLPLKIFPRNSKRLAIDPYFSAGKPIVRDRGIPASVLWGRSQSGDSQKRIAKDYGLTELEVKEAIEDYNWKAAA